MDATREPHSLSLKVLRLSKPSLSQHFPLALPPKGSELYLNPRVALDLGVGEIDDEFILSPMLELPPAFGSAYVGETFSCTLCANNELLKDSERQVSSIKMGAEMQAPSGTIPLDLIPSDEDLPARQVKPGESLQRIVRFDLREEGSHTLAVNLSYSETTILKDKSASSGRVRTFRKLYQFVTRPCLNVRTKVSTLPLDESGDKQTMALEAQLDNLADGPITLQAVTFNPKPAFQSTSLNWDALQVDGAHVDCPTMSPRDVQQIAFLIEPRRKGPTKESTKDGRTILGQLSIQWRTAMGDSGFLSTGWLTTKR